MFRFSFEKGSKIYGDGAYNDDCFETGFRKGLPQVDGANWEQFGV